MSCIYFYHKKEEEFVKGARDRVGVLVTLTFDSNVIAPQAIIVSI